MGPETSTLGCQINESTRLANFNSTCLLGTIFWNSTNNKPTCRLLGPLDQEIYIEYPPYSFIWPYLFNWHLRVGIYKFKVFPKG